MRILHFTDSHEDNRAVAGTLRFATSEGIEVVAATGDFLGPCLSNTEAGAMVDAVRFITSRTNFGPFELGKVIGPLKTQAGVPEDLKQAANVYSILEEIFDKKAKEVYTGLQGLFESFPGQVVLVPGNWDSSKYRENLALWDMHTVFRNVKGVKFAGYGWARGLPSQMSPTRFVPFTEASERELLDFLAKQDPGVALLHSPPYGKLDRITKPNGVGSEHLGSLGGLAYALQECPPLVLCGHVHENLGYEKIGGEIATYVVNSGSLNTQRNGAGTFSVIDIEADEGDAKVTKEPKFYSIDNKSEVKHLD
jgi:uncharacterized protein